MAKCRKEILLPGKGAARIAFNKYFQYSFSSTASRQRTSLTGPPGFPFTVERKSLFKMDFRRRFVSSIVFTFCRVGVKVGGRVALDAADDSHHRSLLSYFPCSRFCLQRNLRAGQPKMLQTHRLEARRQLAQGQTSCPIRPYFLRQNSLTLTY